jgi:hypothetical protein
MAKKIHTEARPKDANRDPLTGASGAHPVGVGAGTATGAAAGAAVGAVGGPVGAVIGTVVGGVAGGLAGKGAAEKVNPTLENEYWQTSYTSRPYFVDGVSYDEYRPAYRYGWESRTRYSGLTWDDAEEDIERNWDKHRGSSRLSWAQAKYAVRDAWHRVERTLPGDADGDGR